MNARGSQARSDAFEIDLTVAPVTVLRLKTADVVQIEKGLRARIASVQQMFPYAPVVVDLAELDEASALELPLHDLADRLRACKLVPVGAANLPPSAVWNAAAAGMAVVQLAANRTRTDEPPPPDSAARRPAAHGGAAHGGAAHGGAAHGGAAHGGATRGGAAAAAPRGVDGDGAPAGALGPGDLRAARRPHRAGAGQRRRAGDRRRPHPCLRSLARPRARWRAGHGRRVRLLPIARGGAGLGRRAVPARRRDSHPSTAAPARSSGSRTATSTFSRCSGSPARWVVR